MYSRARAALVAGLVSAVLMVAPQPSWADSSGVAQEGDGGRAAAAVPAGHEPGVLLVGFRAGVDDQQKDDQEARRGSTVQKRLASINVDVVRLPAGTDETRAIEEFRRDPEVAFAELNFVARADALPTPNDPLYPSQYGPQKVQATDAHNVVYPSGYPVYSGGNPAGVTHPVVAIVDTGIAADASDPAANPDLVRKVAAVAADCTLTSPSATQPCPTSATYDDYGHGTHVAGIAAAETNNGVGIVGIAPGAQLISIKALDSNGSGYYAWIASGILCAADLASCGLGVGRADVVNLSLGGSSGSTTLQAAVRTAQQKGVVVVASAGNSNTTALSYPAAYADLSVIATDSADVRASFSNYGGYANQVSAPGVDILSTVSSDPNVQISDPSGFAYLSGTSMAAPLVSGEAALLAGQGLVGSAIASRIKSTADPLPNATFPDAAHYGAGRVNAHRAVTPPGPPAAPSGLTATPQSASSSQVNLAWSASAGAASYQVERSANGTTGWVVAGTATTSSFADTGLAASTTYWYRVLARNATGTSGYSNTASATTNPPRPAAPTGLTASPVSSSQVNLAWSASAGASSYQVERSANGTTGWVVAGTATTSAFADTGLAASTTYWYRVLARNATGTSGYSNTANATTPPGPPVAPTGLTATPVSGSSSQVNLAWSASAGASSYQVERSANGTTGWVVAGTATTSAFADTGLAASTTYWYRVLARNATGTSGYSNTASATTYPARPTAPTGLTASAVAPTQINLAWTAPTGATGYRVERYDPATLAWRAIGTTGATSFADTSVAPATSYSYRVIATNGGGESAPSATATATTPAGGCFNGDGEC